MVVVVGSLADVVPSLAETWGCVMRSMIVVRCIVVIAIPVTIVMQSVQHLQLAGREAIGQFGKRTPVIVMTAHGNDGPHQGVTAAGLLRFIDWIETLLRRESYLALLLERPVVHERLLRLLGVARWPARYLIQHPGVIDELTSETLLGGRFDAAAFRQDLCQRLASLQSTGEDNEEELLDLLRRLPEEQIGADRGAEDPPFPLPSTNLPPT